MSPSSDKSTVDQEFCGNWQLFWTYLRSTLQLAAVRPLGVQMASIWRPLGVHLELIRRPEGPKLAQEVPKRPKLSPRGAQEAPR